MSVDMIARGMAGRAYKLASNSTTLKNNMSATSAPAVTDDEDAGYDAGSIWVYDNTTYTCVDSSVGKAVWQTSSDIITFNTWAELVAAVSVLSPSYIGNYALVANANGAPSAGITYTYPNSLTDYIVDGGSATIKIGSQGENYSVTTMPRTITNPIVTSVMLIAANKPTSKGYYIFCVVPSDGLPSGINLNDICYYDGTSWSIWQSYSQANTVLVANNALGTTQVTWRKFSGSWMSTSDEYIPDGSEYQTGKLWAGKPVYRRCTNYTLPNSTGSADNIPSFAMPSGGTMLILGGTATRYLSAQGNVRFSIGQPGSSVELYEEMSTGVIKCWLSAGATGFAGQASVIWVEYTKS